MTPSILNAYPEAKDCDVVVITRNLSEAMDDAAKAQVVYDDAFERLEIAIEQGDPQDKISQLRYEAEQAADRLEAAKLDYQEASWVHASFWN